MTEGGYFKGISGTSRLLYSEMFSLAKKCYITCISEQSPLFLRRTDGESTFFLLEKKEPLVSKI